MAENPYGHKLRDVLIAMSVANLFFINAWAPLLYSATKGYYNKLPVTSVTLLALLTDFAWLGLLVWIILRANRRSPSRWLILAGLVILVPSMLLPLDYCRLYVWGLSGDRIVTAFKKPLLAIPLFSLGIVGL
ncbi:MAG TPA: hypothetical protein VG146_06350, partial [Verrucomicrobiae bacterium]|nr:hypothetical protein [Verrucomicrobiae bacterium]